ncbi:adenosylcobinamide-phosphate synthase CbiB [Thalassospira alkalitolerans]|uniref:adenosylcobinamide-phosphate synthase CbiB n=1 Tax=Thalassospira alkalitolerans TaxID=1293890 RepID=UPI003AA92560
MIVDVHGSPPHIAAMETVITEFLIPQAGFMGPLFTVLVLALVLDALCGDFPWLFCRVSHPVVWVGNLIGWFERRLNKPRYGNRDLLMRGLLTSVAVIGCAAGFGGLVQLISSFGGIFVIADILLLAVLIAQKGLYQHVRAVSVALKRDGLSGGRIAVSMIVGRDPNTLDTAGVSRAAIESCAENFSDGVVAPLFWYVLGGPIGLCAYKAINTLDSMIGHRSARYLYFGRFAARLDDVVNFVPARIAGAVICLAAVIGRKSSGERAWTVMLRDAVKHKSPNAGWQEAAFAGALGLSLAGPRCYGAELVDDPYIGDGRRDADASDIDRALTLYTTSCILNAAWPIVLKVLWIGLI